MSPEILERIKKLLRLGRSANQHEAELAMQRAFELAERHRVDIGSLDLDEQSQRLVHEWFPIGMRLDLLQKRSLSLLMDYFHVTVCLSTPRIVFVGRQTDIEIAHYVFEFLVRAGRKHLREWQRAEIRARRKATTIKRKSFVQGFIYGIASKLFEARQQATAQLGDSRTALILAEEQARERHMDSVIPERTTKKIEKGRQNETAMMAGFRTGCDTQIHSPLNGSKQEVLALPAT